MAEADKKTFTINDLSQNPDDVIAHAMSRPVVITQADKPHLVLLNVKDYELLRSRGNPRRVETLETMPDDLFVEFEKAVKTYKVAADD